MNVKGNHPLSEIIAKKLFGIETVPPREAAKMVSRACRAAVEWHTDRREQLEEENARLRAKLKITLNALKYVRDAKGVLIEGEVVDEILPAIEAGEEGEHG